MSMPGFTAEISCRTNGRRYVLEQSAGRLTSGIVPADTLCCVDDGGGNLICNECDPSGGNGGSGTGGSCFGKCMQTCIKQGNKSSCVATCKEVCS
jgi:hypothetical protein